MLCVSFSKVTKLFLISWIGNIYLNDVFLISVLQIKHWTGLVYKRILYVGILLTNNSIITERPWLHRREFFFQMYCSLTRTNIVLVHFKGNVYMGKNVNNMAKMSH